MNQRERLKGRLENARKFSLRLLSDFTSPSDWIHQLHEGGNHALWFVGHMGNTDNFMISMLAPDQDNSLENFGDQFGMGSQPSSDFSSYPAVEDLLEYMQQRREVLLTLLAGLEDEQLDESTPEGTPAFMPDVASVFETAIWHEALHSGQLSMIRRALGHPPTV
jgi:hypothetical protein